MVSEWASRAIGSFAERIRRINLAGEELPPLSVTKDLGVILQSKRFKKRIATDLRKYQIAHRGEFVFDPMSMYYGGIGRQDVVSRGAVSPDYVVFEVDSTVDSDFLLYVLRSPSLRARYESLSERGNRFGKRRRLYWSVFREIDVSVPSEAEQRKIAAILSSVDETIEKTEAVIEQLQVVKKAMMQELLTRGLPGRHTRFKQTEIGKLPQQWDTVSLGDVAHVFNGKGAGTGGSWLRVFKTKHVYDGMVLLDRPEYVRDSIAGKIKKHTYLVAGDTLTPNMAHGTIGRIAYVPEPVNPCTVDGQIMVIRTRDADMIRPRFLFEYMSSFQGRRALLDREVGSIFGERRGQTHLYPQDVRTIPLPRPPIEEQTEITELLASFDAPLRTNTASIEVLRDVKKALMSVLLTGEVRVTPDEAAA